MKSLGIALCFSLFLSSNVCWAIQSEKHAKTHVETLGNSIQQSNVSCLARAIYKEANGTSYKEQLSVAAVILNRSKKLKKNVCQVVMQKGQFSWVNKKNPEKSLTHSTDSRKFLPMAKQIIYDWRKGTFVDYTHGSTHFHTKRVKPAWRKKMVRLVVTDFHIYYKEV